jgi:hypothetical protein
MLLSDEKTAPAQTAGELAALAKARLLEWGVENFALWLDEEREELKTADAHLFAAAAETAEDLLAATLLLAALKAPPAQRSQRVTDTSKLILSNAYARAAIMEKAADAPHA